MFNIGLGEVLFIAILILVFVGPERLPQLMKQLGEYTAQIRRVIRNFNQEFAEELKPLHEIRNLADDLNPTRQLGNLIDPDVQRSAPKRPEYEKPKSNPMSQISQAASEEGSGQSTTAPPDASGSKETPANPMAQISQAMMAQSTDNDSGQPTIATPYAPGAKTPDTSPMAKISQAMTGQDTPAQPESSSEAHSTSDDTQEA